MLRNSFVYLTGNAFIVLISFISIPILTNYLSKEEYGLYGLYLVLANTFSVVITMNLHSSISVEYFKLKKIVYLKYSSDVIAIPLINSAILSICLSILLFFGYSNYIINSKLFYIILIGFFSFYPNVVLSFFQSSQKTIKYILFQVSHKTVSYAFLFVFLIFFKTKSDSYIFGFLLSNIIMSIVAIKIIFDLRFKRLKPYLTNIKKGYLFGFRIILHGLSGIVLSMSDRFMISELTSVSEAGLYTAAYQIVSIITVFSVAINKSTFPRIVQDINQARIKNAWKTLRIAFGLIGLIFVIMVLSKPLIIKILLSEDFQNAKSYYYPLIIGLLFQGLYMIISVIFFAKSKVKLLSTITFGSALLNILLNYFLILKYGAIGAAYSTMICYGIFLIITVVISQRLINSNC